MPYTRKNTGTTNTNTFLSTLNKQQRDEEKRKQQLINKSKTLDKEVGQLQNDIKTISLKLQDDINDMNKHLEKKGWTDEFADMHHKYQSTIDEQTIRGNIIKTKLKQWEHVNNQLEPIYVALSVAKSNKKKATELKKEETELKEEIAKLDLEYDKNSKTIKWQRENHSTKHPDFQAAIEKQLKCVKTRQQKSAQLDKALEQISAKKTSSTGGKKRKTKRRRKTKRYVKKK